MSSMPKNCVVCANEFDPKNPEQLDSWMICVNDSGISMFCNECYDEKS